MCGEREDGRERTDLAGSVNYIAVVLDALVVDALGEGALDGRIIRFNEMVLDVLYNEGGFAWEEERA